MENIKEALGGKSPNNQRATRPGVVQMSNDGSTSGSVATITAASAGEDCTPPLPQLVAQGPADAPLEEIGGIPPQITLTSSRMQQRSLISPEPQDRQADPGGPDSDRTPGHTDLDPQPPEEVDAIIVSDAAAPAADTPLQSPPNNDGGGEESTAFSQDPQQQALPQEHQVDSSEELLVAEVELMRPGDDNDDEQRTQTTEEQPVSSIQLLTQSSFPVAQVVDAPVEESEDEEEEGGEHIRPEEEVGETANIDYSHVVLIQQEVALATTDGRNQDEQDLSSSSREEGDNKFKLIPKRRSNRFVCGVIGVLAVVACVLGAVFAVNNNASSLTTGSEGTATDDSKNDLTVDDDMNVVEVLLKAFLEKIGTNDHRITGTPQYKAIQWLYESAREGSERFNLSEWAIRQLLVQRYVMAVFYYTTGGTGTWDDDCGFVTAKNECEWKCTKNSNAAGITCDESSRIQKILLPNNNLSGPIPIEFKALTSLVEIDISNNSIQGQLPEGIGDLQNMKSFNAAHNELTGNLPSSLGNLSFLGSLNLMDNNLTGEIPPEVNRLGSLSSLWLSGNGFTGGMNNFCDSENRSLLRHQHRRFLVSTFYADCSSIACDCCTHCCVSDMAASSCQPNNP